MSNSKDIFKARKADWWNNACFNFNPTGNRWTGYSMGYKHGADILADYVDKTAKYQDTLVYPILFLYRHYLELIIKEILTDCAYVLDEKANFKHHNLSNYWVDLKNKCLQIVGQSIPSSLTDPIESVVGQISHVDAISDAFRYPCKKDGAPTLQGIQYINIKQVNEELAKASDALEAISATIYHAVEMTSESRSAMM